MSTRGKPPSLDYLAGLFDGEGSISIIRSTRQDSIGGITHQLRVAVGMIDRDAVLAFHARWPGSFYERPAQTGRQTAYFWTLGSRRAVAFLTELLPHLRIKEAQAKLGLQFQALLGGRTSNGVLEENFAKRVRCWRQMRSLNGMLKRHAAPAETKREGVYLLDDAIVRT